jgi:hypothetical protein
VVVLRVCHWTLGKELSLALEVTRDEDTYAGSDFTVTGIIFVLILEKRGASDFGFTYLRLEIIRKSPY